MSFPPELARTPLPNESAFTTAFWVGAAGVAVAAFIALHVTPLRLRRQLRLIHRRAGEHSHAAREFLAVATDLASERPAH